MSRAELVHYLCRHQRNFSFSPCHQPPGSTFPPPQTHRRSSCPAAIQSRWFTRRRRVDVCRRPAPSRYLMLVVISLTHTCNALSCSAFSWKVW